MKPGVTTDEDLGSVASSCGFVDAGRYIQWASSGRSARGRGGQENSCIKVPWCQSMLWLYGVLQEKARCHRIQWCSAEKNRGSRVAA